MPGTTDHAAIGDRVKLPMSFDATRMLDEVRALQLPEFIHYNVVQLTAPAHMVDPTRTPPPPVDDYADGSWTEWLETPALRKCPYLRQIVETFREHTDVTLVRLLRLEAGGLVKEHNDPTLGLEIERSLIRLTIPILINDGVTFFLSGTPVPMKPGECWYLQFTQPHKIINAGATERINMSIDMIPNEWVRSLIAGAA